jgi:NAD(P)-dependent dehydrogenase (short-subunit alcohol dehydrogenase family)
MPIHILVTGGAGFIGSHLTRRLLARGDRVTVLDDFNDFYDPARKRANLAPLLAGAEYADRCRLVEGDIRDHRLIDRLFAESGLDAQSASSSAPPLRSTASIGRFLSPRTMRWTSRSAHTPRPSGRASCCATTIIIFTD